MHAVTYALGHLFLLLVTNGRTSDYTGAKVMPDDFPLRSIFSATAAMMRSPMIRVWIHKRKNAVFGIAKSVNFNFERVFALGFFRVRPESTFFTNFRAFVFGFGRFCFCAIPESWSTLEGTRKNLLLFPIDDRKEICFY